METLNIANTNTKEILVQMINKIIDGNKWSSKKAAHILQTPLSGIRSEMWLRKKISDKIY